MHPFDLPIGRRPQWLPLHVIVEGGYWTFTGRGRVTHQCLDSLSVRPIYRFVTCAPWPNLRPSLTASIATAGAT